MSMLGAGGDAQTVPIRLQVIDVEPFALDLVVPTFIPAKDLTQRLARDAGLQAYWEDGTRRLYWVRARGRVLGEEERLQDLGIVPHELLHLLPQPPAGSGVVERPPDYPARKGYAGGGWIVVASGLGGLFAWAILWSIALSASQSIALGLFPGLALGLLTTTAARHAWGGRGSHLKIPASAMPLALLIAAIAIALPVFVVGIPGGDLAVAGTLGVVGVIVGVVIGWLAWFGAVEPLPERTIAEVQHEESQQVHQCAICGGQVTPDVRMDCVYACGRVFHVGCYQARASVSHVEGCAVCGYNPAAAAG